MASPSLYCDNYSSCNSYLYGLATKEATETKARVRGWHLFDGTTIGGAPHRGTLCPKCVGPHRGPVISGRRVLEGQEALFPLGEVAA
jgi:hypothetical protein